MTLTPTLTLILTPTKASAAVSEVDGALERGGTSLTPTLTPALTQPSLTPTLAPALTQP